PGGMPSSERLRLKGNAFGTPARASSAQSSRTSLRRTGGERMSALSTYGTSGMHWGADTSLIAAAREIAPIIRNHRAEAGGERPLAQPVLEALRETGLLRMSTPRSLGGLETDPVTRALVAEEIGRHDSAAAWTLENPLDWAFFCARLPDDGAEEIYG